ncbi:MAG: multidrug transporter [Thermoplasmata archaeon]|nr:MAG: multidrug transporter [Thermoplasmata archaeon]
MVNIISLILALVNSFLGASGAIFLKKGSGKIFIKKTVVNSNLIIAGLLYLLSFIFFLIAIKFDDISIVYPITSVSYIWVVVLSAKFLKEKITTIKTLSLFLIIAGVCMLSLT